MEDLPKKLKIDSILEAVLEIRFEPDPSTVSEIFLGKLASVEEWRGFRQARLPAADLPSQMRVDPAFKFQTTVDLTSNDGTTSFRIGPNAISYHRRAPYPGWEDFGARLRTAVNNLFEILPNVEVRRLGLRYVNGLSSASHGIKSIADLAISAAVSGQNLERSLNLNFRSNFDTNFETMNRIATVDMAEGNISADVTVLVDIDVFSTEGYSEKSSNGVVNWIEEAHRKEKESFFRVLGVEATNRLRIQ